VRYVSPGLMQKHNVAIVGVSKFSKEFAKGLIEKSK
jgi:hypothetical protein